MIRSIVKWPGGKGRVIPDLLPHLPKADCMIEPFVGGASVFLNTNYRRYVLADINPDLINLYRQVTHWPEQVINYAYALFKTYGDVDGYAWVRKDFNARARDCSAPQGLFPNGPDTAKIIRAAQFLYLNRHGYNGVVRYNQRGGYNVPFGRHKTAPYLPEAEIRQFSEKAKDTNTIFMCCPFEVTIQATSSKDAVLYCDPPYLPVSETANFTQYHSTPFGASQHRELVATLLAANIKHGIPVVLSNSDTAATREIYKAFNFQEISVNRSVSSKVSTRAAAKEVIGVLKVCAGCGRHGGGRCPDCGPSCGDATYNEMVASGAFEYEGDF